MFKLLVEKLSGHLSISTPYFLVTITSLPFLCVCVCVNNVSSPWSSQSSWKHSDPVLMMFPWVRSHHTPFWTFYFYLYYVLYHIYYLVFYQLYVSLIYLDLLLEVKGQCLVQHCTFHNSWYDVRYVIIMLIRFMLLITFFWLVE